MNDLTKISLTALLTIAGTYLVTRWSEPFKGSLSYANRLKEIRVAKFHDKMLEALEGIAERMSRLEYLAGRHMQMLRQLKPGEDFEEVQQREVDETNEYIIELRHYLWSKSLYLPRNLNAQVDELCEAWIQETRDFLVKRATSDPSAWRDVPAKLEKCRSLGNKVKDAFRDLIQSDKLTQDIRIEEPVPRRP